MSIGNFDYWTDRTQSKPIKPIGGIDQTQSNWSIRQSNWSIGRSKSNEYLHVFFGWLVSIDFDWFDRSVRLVSIEFDRFEAIGRINQTRSKSIETKSKIYIFFLLWLISIVWSISLIVRSISSIEFNRFHQSVRLVLIEFNRFDWQSNSIVFNWRPLAIEDKKIVNIAISYW